MRRYLVVANQTLQAAELREELGTKISAGPCSFFVIVPDTTAADYDPVAAGGALPHPGMWWWATSYARPATDEEATAQARQRLSLMLAGLAGMGVPVEGDLGSPSPLEAMGKVLADHQFDEIIVATLPRRVSRWLGADLPHQAERRFGLPVTTIITRLLTTRPVRRPGVLAAVDARAALTGQGALKDRRAAPGASGRLPPRSERKPFPWRVRPHGNGGHRQRA